MFLIFAIYNSQITKFKRLNIYIIFWVQYKQSDSICGIMFINAKNCKTSKKKQGYNEALAIEVKGGNL